jgi:hypothetical protein
MNKFIKHFMLTFFSSFILLSLLLANDSTSNNINVKNSIDTFIQDLPLNKKGKPPRQFELVRKIENIIGLKKITNGFDSIQMRIWSSYRYNDSTQLLIIKNSFGNWTIEAYNLFLKFNVNDDSLIGVDKIMTVDNKQIITQNEWKKFTKKIFNLDITTLPDSRYISNYYDATEADIIIFEISTQFKYRFYTYEDPLQHKKTNIQAKKIINILDLIDKTFKMKRFRK